MAAEKTLIFIPTFNEAKNVEIIYAQIKTLKLDADLLFLDDNSPDGTGAIIDKIIQRDRRVFVIHRKNKRGIGSAHQDGIAWAYQKKYTQLITMDCDFSHSPEYLRAFIQAGTKADVVVGSRYLKEKSLETWSLGRKFLTKLGNFLTKVLLRMPYDATGAFRLYNLRKIPQEVFGLVQSLRYAFFFESLFILHLNRLTITEVPIHLPARTYGESKMSIKDVFVSFTMLLGLWTRSIFQRNTVLLNQKRA